MIIDQRYLVVVTGPTAVGKTSLTIRLAQLLKTEIISADSRQFYQEMLIGTARPDGRELELVPHHFTGHLSIHDNYNVSRFEADGLELLDNLFNVYRTVILTGGSGLYIDALINGLDDLPEAEPELREELKILFLTQGIAALRSRLQILDPEFYKKVDLANPKRLIRALEVCITTGKPYSTFRTQRRRSRNFITLMIGLAREKNELNNIINNRVDSMMEKGLLGEVESLLPFRKLNALNTVGYKELFPYFDGEMPLGPAVGNIKTHSRRYAKRQMTWFRRDKSINWFHPEKENEIFSFIKQGTSN